MKCTCRNDVVDAGRRLDADAVGSPADHEAIVGGCGGNEVQPVAAGLGHVFYGQGRVADGPVEGRRLWQGVHVAVQTILLPLCHGHNHRLLHSAHWLVCRHKSLSKSAPFQLPCIRKPSLNSSGH